MLTAVLEKGAVEETTIGVTIAGLRELQRGEVPAHIAVEARLSGEVVTDIVVSHAFVQQIGEIRIRLRGGDVGRVYMIRILITTDAGHVREIIVPMHVIR